jgi:hypothetical protein
LDYRIYCDTYNLDLLQCQLLRVQTRELVGSVLLAGYESSHGGMLESKTDRYVGGEKKKRERSNRIQDERMMECSNRWLAGESGTWSRERFD